MRYEPGLGLSAVQFEYELLMPAQWQAMLGASAEGEPENRLKIELIDSTLKSLQRLALHAETKTNTGKAALARLLNIMAWVDDVDGERARAMGAPWRITFRQACEVFPRIEAEAVADAFRAAYRKVKREQRMAVVAA